MAAHTSTDIRDNLTTLWLIYIYIRREGGRTRGGGGRRRRKEEGLSDVR